MIVLHMPKACPYIFEKVQPEYMVHSENPATRSTLKIQFCIVYGQFTKLIKSKYIARVLEFLSFSDKNINPHFS